MGLGDPVPSGLLPSWGDPPLPSNVVLIKTGFVPFLNKKFKEFSRTFKETFPIFQGLHLGTGQKV